MPRIKESNICGSIKVEINIDTGISLWQAIKLRIAGRAYEPIAKDIAAAIVRKIEAEKA